jgi:hypothetical protein
MPYRPIAPQSDDRRAKQGCAPIRLTNALVRKSPANDPRAGRAQFFIGPTPGRTLVTRLPGLVRGLFCAEGCQSGRLFIAAGGNLYVTGSPSGGVANLGVLDGGDTVIMRADRANLGVMAFGKMKLYDGSSLTQVTDANAPSFASTFWVCARRWGAAFVDNDAFGWAKAGLPLDWDPNAQAQDQNLPDPIRAQETIGNDLWSFNAKSAQIWQPTGGPEASAFAPVQGININVGIVGRDASAKLGKGRMLLGSNRVVHVTQGYDLVPVENLAFEQDLKSVTPAQLAGAIAFSYQDGGKEFWGCNVAGLERTPVFDAQTGLWHERAAYGKAEYDVHYTADAFSRTFAASKDDNALWTVDEDVFTDAGEPIVREFTFSIPSQGEVPVDRIVFDINTRALPLSGQGSAPVMQVRYSNDNGERWETWRDVELPTPLSRQNGTHTQDWGMPQASAEYGLLVQARITDPIGFSIYGIWVNPTEEELNT